MKLHLRTIFGTWLRGRGPSVPTEESSSLGVLGYVIEELRNLNQHTESDFLGIGGKLMEFLQTAEGISTGLNSVTVQISGEHGRHASEVLVSALERCRRMESCAMERSRDLKSLREGAGAVRGTFSGFRDFVATFRALCTLTRIETARLGGAGADFGSLTEDVESLAESMGAKAENVLEAAILLDQRVQDTFAKLSDVDVLLKDLSLVIAGVMGSLDDFSNQQAAAVALSTRLVSDCNSAAASIKDAVMSIQFHDITRQQVEHVIDALGQVQAENRDRPSCLSREATAALALEASQLADAEKKFTVSVARLSDDLGNIAACVREMAGNGRGLLHASGNEQESFFLKMEECLTVILNAARSFDLAKNATRKAAGELDATLESMRYAAGGIRAIDLQLLRVALNACLQAAHLGATGETLNVLALALQDLAVRSQERSAIVGEALDSMSGSVTRLLKTDDSAEEKTRADEEAAAEELRSTIGELHSWTEISFKRITETTRLASQLCDDISALRGSFTAGRLFSEVVTRCRGRLVQLASEAGPASSDEGMPVLENLAKSYTMQAERDVHAAVTGGLDTEPTEWQTAGVSSDGPGREAKGELGDNVELF